MIDRYSIAASTTKIHDRFKAEVIDTLGAKYNAAPTHLLPVITMDSPQGVSVFYWGTSPEWSKNKALSEKIINIAAESIVEKSTIRKALAKGRCLILADGFYAWKKVGKKTAIPYRFVVTDQEVFAMAGLWEEFEDTDGNSMHTFKLITVPSNVMVSAVQERMPAILTPATEKIWMDKQSDETKLLETLKPYEVTHMNYYPVSARIADSQVNVPSLVVPTPPSDQFGNLTLFD
jgi:putative SOS response-associated peptidase YedK